jgi:hypothetical protein
MRCNPEISIFILDPHTTRQEKVIIKDCLSLFKAESKAINNKASRLKPSNPGYSQTDLLTSRDDPFLPE